MEARSIKVSSFNVLRAMPQFSVMQIRHKLLRGYDEGCCGAYLVMDGMVATIPAHIYIMGIRVLGLFFRSHIKDPNAARDILNT